MPPPRRRGRKVLAVFLVFIGLWVLLGMVGDLRRVWVSEENRAAYSTFDILIRDGYIVDGTGRPGYVADIGIRGDRIAEIGDLSLREGEVTINASGLVVAPGFINPHSHSDRTILQSPHAESALRQGVTTEIIGTDGKSPLSVSEHLNRVAAVRPAVNYAMLIGQGTVRAAVMGSGPGRASEAQLKRMEELVRKAMEEGAVGLSSGLEYVPGKYTTTEELVRLVRVLTPYQAVYSTHIRNERVRILAAVDEALSIAREAQVPLNISHIKVARTPSWPAREDVLVDLTHQVIARIQAARRQGQEVYADFYPYGAPWFLIERGLSEMYGRYPSRIIYILRCADRSAEGKSLTQLAAERGVSVAKVVQELRAHGEPVQVYVKTLSEQSMAEFLKQDFTLVGTDAPAVSSDPGYSLEERLHPRAFGTYPKIIRKYVREENLLTLEEAIHKMTLGAAQLYQLKGRGMIATGYYADLTIFNPAVVREKTTYHDPARYPEGIEYVLVNGQVAVSGGELQKVRDSGGKVTTVRNGRVLLRGRF